MTLVDTAIFAVIFRKKLNGKPGYENMYSISKHVCMDDGNIDLSRLNRLLLEDVYPEEIVLRRTDMWKACQYFSEMLVECIGDLVDPGNSIMKWFQDIVEALGKTKQGMAWVAPSGFPVLQETWNRAKKGVGKKPEMTLRIPDPKLGLNVAAQKRKIVANVIHSLDAAHMILTIHRLSSEKPRLRHFGVIHDSYAVHACDIDRLRQTLREEFVAIYKKDSGEKAILQKFVEAQRNALQEAMKRNPPKKKKDLKRAELAMRNPPAFGTLHIEEVLKSDYFFC